MRLYRVEGKISISFPISDYDENPIRHHNIHIHEFDVLSETKEGYWINMGMTFNGEPPIKKWVSKSSKKRFAYPTRKEAYESFMARKKRQIKILGSQINDSRKFLWLVEKEYSGYCDILNNL